MKAQFFYDSTFANGAYSHSFGLESYIAWKQVNDAKSYQAWLQRYMLDNFALNEGVIYELVCKLKNKKLSILKLCVVANASILSLEAKNAAINMARATLKNTEFMHDDLAKWYSKVCENDRFANPAVACAIVGGDMGEAFAYASIKTLTQNATRAIPLSYKKSCEILYSNLALAKTSHEKSVQIASNMLKNGCFSLKNFDEVIKTPFLNTSLFSTHFELDIAMQGHEKLDFRLFMS